MTKRIAGLLADAREAGMQVTPTASGGHLVIAQRHRRTNQVLRGLAIYHDGTAIDLTVPLSATRAIRSTDAMRQLLQVEFRLNIIKHFAACLITTAPFLPGFFSIFARHRHQASAFSRK